MQIERPKSMTMLFRTCSHSILNHSAFSQQLINSWSFGAGRHMSRLFSSMTYSSESWADNPKIGVARRSGGPFRCRWRCQLYMTRLH